MTSSSPRWIPQAGLDVLLILLFAVVGRASHREAVTALGVLQTAWPFVAGAVLGWLVSRAWRTPHELSPSGVTVWLGTWLFGMALRVVTGGGFAAAFLIVAGLFLALTTFGGRFALGRLDRRTERNHTS